MAFLVSWWVEDLATVLVSGDMAAATGNPMVDSATSRPSITVVVVVAVWV